MDTDSQLITAVEVLPGNAPDNLGALELVEASGSQHRCAGGGGHGRCRLWRRPYQTGLRRCGTHPDCPSAGPPQPVSLSKEDFRIDLESGSCTCPAGQVTRTIVPAGRRTDQMGRTYRFGGLPIRRGGLWSVLAAVPVPGGKTGTGRTVRLHPQEALLQQARALQHSEGFAEYRQRRVVVEHRLARLVQLGIRQSPLLRPHQNQVPVVLGRHGGQLDPGGRQSRVDGRNRLRSQRWQRPGRWNGQLRRQFRGRVARSNLGPHFARGGLTA